MFARLKHLDNRIFDISVSVELENNSSNFVFSSEEFASLNKQTVIKRALYEIKMLLNENLIQSVIN